MGKKIAVLGLGREGRATLNFLKKYKIKAEVLDAKFGKNYIGVKLQMENASASVELRIAEFTITR